MRPVFAIMAIAVGTAFFRLCAYRAAAPACLRPVVRAIASALPLIRLGPHNSTICRMRAFFGGRHTPARLDGVLAQLQ